MKNIKLKTKIKVIKKNDIGVVKKVVVEKKKPKELAAREIASTVNEWVDELQKRRIHEGRAAVDRIYKQRLQTASDPL